MNPICKICNLEVDKNNYLKDRTVCKRCYNKNRRKTNNNTLIQSEQPKSDNDKKKKKPVESLNNRTLIVGFLNCGKTYLMNHILYQKQEPILLIARSSLNQYPDIKAQSSDEIQPLNEYENSVVVSDDMLLSKQDSNIELFFTRGRHNNNDIYYKSQNYFHFPQNTIRNNSKITILFKQTLRDIKLLFHDIAGLDMNLEEWKQLCRKAWETDYDYLQIDSFAKRRNGRYTITKCNKNNYIECTPETKPF